MSSRKSRPGAGSDRDESGHRTTRLTAWALPAAVAVITFVAFIPALQAGFVAWDDQSNFLENPHYRGLGWANLRWMWSNFLLGHYVPLAWMTLGLDYVMWGMNPAGYHLTSLLMHTANAVLLYLLARRILAMTGALGRPIVEPVLGVAAAIAALLFGVHPLRAESVVWVTERRDVLSGFFYLLTLLCYLRFARDAEAGRKWYALALTLFTCALLSKATSVTLPAVLVVLNVYPLRRLGTDVWSSRSRRVYTELAPFFGLAAAFVVLTFVALQSMPQLTVAKKIAVSAYSLAFYLWKSIAPTRLAPLYDLPPDIDPTDAVYVGCYLLGLGLTVGALVARRKHPGVTTAWVLFVLILLPLLGVHQNGPQIAADRYTYNAAPVLAILAAAGWASLRRPFSGIPVTLAGAVILVLSVLTWKQSTIWHDSHRMWSQVLSLNPRSSLALTALGNAHVQAGNADSAILYFTRSLAIDPASPEARNNLGIALYRLGRSREAIEQFRRAALLKPDHFEARNNWGLAIADTAGRLDEAIAHYQAALQIKPDYADPHVNWGNALVQQGKPGEAISHYQRAIAIRPDNADAHRNWGVALARQGRFDEAIRHFRIALELRPGFSDVVRLLDHATALQKSRR